jgi:hypothetical protein
LKLVEGGRVPRGSYLVVENLDRLTREDIWSALDLVSSLLKAGVRIVQLKPVEQVIDKASGPMVAMMAIMELSRGHSESQMKSERVSAAWKNKKAAAREGKLQPPRRQDGRVSASMTDLLPAWVQDKGGKLCLVAERVRVIRRIFHLAAAGRGVPSIIRELDRDGIPSFGRTGRWTRQYVYKILSERRVLGEFQPRDTHHRPQGEPIPGYYPAAVSEAEWLQARAGTEQRRRFKGRGGVGQVNVFANILRHARDGDSYIMTQRVRQLADGKQKVAILINSEGEQQKVRQYSLPYAVFETAILRLLREIDPHEILNGDQPPDETGALAAELVGVEAEIADAAAFMEANGFSPTIGKRIADLEARKARLAEQLVEARHQAAHPLSESWGECKSLVDTLAAAPDQRDARLRLRSALRRIADTIMLLVVVRGQDRLAAVQIWFAGGKRHRDYLILYRRGGGGGANPFRPAQSWVRSLADVAKPGSLDLRDRGHAVRLEKALAAAELNPE